MIDDSDSRTAITELIHRYAFNVRMRQGQLCADLFTADASYELREIDAGDRSAVPRRRWLLEGRDAIRDYIGKSTQGETRICPIITNIMIEIGDLAARSNCMMSSHSWPAGRGTIGEYDDRYRLVDGRWLFDQRIYTIFLA